MIDLGRLNTFTGFVIGISFAATTLSAFFLGPLGDRVGHRRVVIASSCLAALLYFAQTFVTAGWQLLVLQALVGVALGGIVPIISALLARLTHSGEEGVVYGMDNSITAGSRTLAPLLGAFRRGVLRSALSFFILSGIVRFYSSNGNYISPQEYTKYRNRSSRENLLNISYGAQILSVPSWRPTTTAMLPSGRVTAAKLLEIIPSTGKIQVGSAPFSIRFMAASSVRA